MKFIHTHIITLSPELFELFKKGPTDSQRLLEILVIEVKGMKDQLDALRAEIARESDLIAAAKVAFKGLADQISANANNPEGLAELVKTLREQDDSFAAAVAENTPAAPPAPVV